MRVEVTRERGAFGFGPAKIVVDFLDAAGTIERQDDADWDVALDAWLVEQGARAGSVENERLRRRPQPLLRELGDSYFNSLLVRVLKDGPYADHPEVGPRACSTPVDEAAEILAGAIAMYLDERFHLTERQRLFGT